MATNRIGKVLPLAFSQTTLNEGKKTFWILHYYGLEESTGKSSFPRQAQRRALAFYEFTRER